uniref:Uncharacterized protein n=1 Tax=Rhizophora mucronata TaxID=61149 RepID=A0A2P2P547_RHIMU
MKPCYSCTMLYSALLWPLLYLFVNRFNL